VSARARAAIGLLAGVGVGLGLGAGRARADDSGSPPPEEPSEKELLALPVEELLNVRVSSSSKTEEAVADAPDVVSVLTREQIQQHRWYTINDVLGHLPGFAPSHDYDRETISSRGAFEGWNNNHLLLLVDGVPFNDNLYGTAFTWDVTPLTFLRSLEVIRGPGSALYGTNATAGVVTINTVSARELGSRAAGELRIGTRGTRYADVLATDQREWLSTVVAFSYSRNAGNEYQSYDGSGRTDANGKLAQFRIRDNREGGYLFAKAEAAGALEGLSVQLHYQWWGFETGHGWLWMVPDLDEAMRETRQIAVLRYRPPVWHAIEQEYVVRYQRHDLDWNMEFYPQGTMVGAAVYPDGLWEYLRTKAEDVFARAQAGYRAGNQARVLAGVESTVFWYLGDREHYSNADLSGDLAPFPGNVSHRVGPWFEWILNKPVVNIAAFGHASSGRALGERVTAHLGLRYDRELFQYVDIRDQARPTLGKSFQQLSPRAGLVVKPTGAVSVKALVGHAFRAPAPTELFGANTLTLASNPAELKPEKVKSYELAADSLISPAVVLRGNIHYTQLQNQIGYSLQNANLSTNLYSLDTVGFETELHLELGAVQGAINYTYARRVHEKILDATISQSSNQLTWYPSHVANASAQYRHRSFDFDLEAHFQGTVHRRDSDRQNAMFASLRPAAVDPWLTIDASAGYLLRPGLRVSLQVTNLFDSKGSLIKNFDFPFDYRIPGRAAFGSLRVSL
jgi:iron complex outermembrane receptor protein